MEFLKNTVSFVLFLFLSSWLLEICWNAVMPEVFGLRELGYWQSMALFYMCHLLLRVKFEWKKEA